VATRILEGRPGSPGLGVGALFRADGAIGPSNGHAVPDGAPAGPPSADRIAFEQARLLAALSAAAAQLDGLAAETGERAGPGIGAIFEAQALFARDPGLVDPALRGIATDGRSAVQAIELAAAEQAAVLAAVDDAYFRERAADVRDVGRRVIDILLGHPPVDLHRADGAPAIIVAEDLDASVVATLRTELVSGIALAGGAANGHAAIVARALGIPMTLGLGGSLADALEGVRVAVDGTGGRLLIEPAETDLAALAETLRGTSGVSSNGGGAPRRPSHGGSDPSARDARAAVRWALEANAGSVREVEQAMAAGASGIGLFRTELLFLGRSVPPSLEEQRAIYRRVLEAAAGVPVVFRTLDVGGDKPAGYQRMAPEANPALGIRGLRLGLRQPELLEVQLRALLEAAAEGELRVMFPMVATLEEVRAARAVVESIVDACGEAGIRTAASVRIGIMVEVPAAALMVDAIAGEVDFLSIGTNDLVQYTMAADRTSPGLDDLATALQPSVLRLVARVIAAAHPLGRSVAVCGEAAADPLVGPLLVGMGVDELSVAPAVISSVRTRLEGLDAEACRLAATEALSASTVDEIRAIAGRIGRA
jgi:phosphoenolpyruvate-protein phosphotransferase